MRWDWYDANKDTKARKSSSAEKLARSKALLRVLLIRVDKTEAPLLPINQIDRNEVLAAVC